MISLIQLFEYLDLKDVRQSKSYTCGPAIMQSILASYGNGFKRKSIIQINEYNQKWN